MIKKTTTLFLMVLFVVLVAQPVYTQTIENSPVVSTTNSVQIPIYTWSVFIEDSLVTNNLTLNSRDFLSALDQNKVHNIKWVSTIELLNNNEDKSFRLPQAWLPFKVFVNNHDITPLTLRNPVKGSIYATNEILVSKLFLQNGINTFKLEMNGSPSLLGFRGGQIPLLEKEGNLNITSKVIDFLNNYIHSFVYPFVSIALAILALLLLRIYSHKKEEHLFFAVANLLFQPYNFLTSELYSTFSSNPEFPFKFQIYFQAISWTFWGYYFMSQTDNPKIKKVMYHKAFYIPLVIYFLAIGIAWSSLSFFQLSQAVILPFLVPVVVSPYWLLMQKNHHRFSFVLAFFCVVSGYITFFSHLTKGDLYLTGHTIFIFGILAFKDLVKNFTTSIRRDQSAGALLRNLLPTPMVNQISNLLTEGATFENIRNSLQGDSVVTTIFVDICSFGEMTRKLSSKTMAAVRIEVFEHLKNVAEKNKHFFIKCVGDNIHFSSGFMGESQFRQSELSTSCLRVVKEMLDSIDQLNLHLKGLELPSVKLKISATIGHGEFGLEGTKAQVRYDVFGHWVNATKRLEDSMNADFYKAYGYNCALVSTNLFNQCEDVHLRKRFFIPFEVKDKHGITYSAYVGQQYETHLGKEELLAAVYGQFAHDSSNKEEKGKIA